jgi:hypothetical protein
MTIEERSAERRKRIEANIAQDFQEAEEWDLQYWQDRTPQERLAALAAIRRDVEKVEAARRAAGLPDFDGEDGD